MDELKPDYSLVRDWQTAQKEAPQPFEWPYVAQFHQGATHLHYIAACHGGDINSATLKTIKAEFDNFMPDAVVVEGVHSEEISPSWYLDHCQQQAKENYREGGEGSYATVLAGQNNIPFIPAEPSDWQMYQGFLKQGYTLHDMLGWNAARVIQSHCAAGLLDDSTVDGLVDESIQRDLQELAQKDHTLTGHKFASHDFRNWYREKMAWHFSPAGIADADSSPMTGPGANFLQKMMAAADAIREPHIVELIARQLTDFKKVLVVYGASHLDKQEQVFRKMLGNPTYAKPFSDDETLDAPLSDPVRSGPSPKVTLKM
jgi:hypothetical protein